MFNTLVGSLPQINGISGLLLEGRDPVAGLADVGGEAGREVQAPAGVVGPHQRLPVPELAGDPAQVGREVPGPRNFFLSFVGF